MSLISGEINSLAEYKKEADRKYKNYGVTDLYSTGVEPLDDYFAGGYGQAGGYEIITLFGGTGIGKTTVALNFLLSPMANGNKVGLIILEDSYADIYNRLRTMGDEDLIAKSDIHTLKTRGKKWSLDNLLAQIKSWFKDLGVDVILLDHLQFAFEASESIKGEDEYNRQRKFMRDLNNVMVELEEDGVYGKAIIIISHTNKDKNNKGLGKIQGSGGIAQASTKVIEVDRVDEDTLMFSLLKNRHAPRQDCVCYTSFNNQKLGEVQWEDES